MITRQGLKLVFRLAILLCLLRASLLGATEAPVSYEQLREAVAVSQPFGVQQCQQLADAFGVWVVRQRDSDTTAARLLDGQKLGDHLHANCRAAIRDIEAATNEDEAALESLYRSELWYELNRALAALRYWQSWLNLSLAQHAQDRETRVTALLQAERGFQASSLRILYPGLVYGSWLGLAYVAQLQEDSTTMKQRLLLLKRALAPDPENPLNEIVDTELGLLALQFEGSDAIELVASEPLTPATARLLEEKAFALLAERRKNNSGGFEAASYLRRLIDQGYLDDRLFARMLSYQDEIVGYEIGPIAYLVEAEFAYAYQQYESNVLKFQQFLESSAVNFPLDLSVFSYHYAVALYQLGLHRDAMVIIDELRDADSVAPELLPPLIKLQFIVAEAMYQDDPSTVRAAVMRTAAEAYIASAGSDPDSASAHLALARIENDSAQQARHLTLAAADSRLKGNVLAVKLELAVADFQQLATRAGPAQIRESAAESLALLESLPGEQQDTLAMQVLALQLDSVLVKEPKEILGRIDVLSQNPGLNPTQKRVLEWSRLRLIGRLLGESALRQYVSEHAGKTDPAFDHELYVLLRELQYRGQDAELASLGKAWLPALADRPQLQRQVWLLYVDALRATGRNEEALEAIHDMLSVFPTSGDAWQLLADQSVLMGDSFAAERALAHIAEAEPQGSTRWLAVSLQRLQLLAAGDNPGVRACALASTIAIYNHRLQNEQQQILAALITDMGCPQRKE